MKLVVCGDASDPFAYLPVGGFLVRGIELGIQCIVGEVGCLALGSLIFISG